MEGISLDMIGNSSLTTDSGKVIRMAKQRSFWGLNLYPFMEPAQGRDVIPSLYVTNFTVGKPWTLSVPVSRGAQSSPRKWPCGPSRYLPADDHVCDIILNGFQTLPQQPTVIKNLTDYEVPACCPEGILRYGKDDACCVDNLAENPYTLAYASTNSSVADDTVFSFALNYKGAEMGDLIGSDPYRPNCSVSEVDQLELYVAPAAASLVYRVEVDGQEVDFTRGSNGYQSWVRAINLAFSSHTPSSVKLFVRDDMTAEQLCPTTASSSPLCEYVFKGAYDDTEKEFTCCPHGATAVRAATCPAV